MKIGYARISTPQQSLENQIIKLKEIGCEQIYQEIASGMKSDRPILKDCLGYIRPGDTLIVTDIDRLGRNKWDLLTLIRELKDKGINFQSINQGLDFNTPVGEMMLMMFVQLAEMERNLFRERVIQGLNRARARGRKGGRRGISAATQNTLKVLYDSKTMTISAICKQLNISKRTLYNYIKKMEETEKVAS